MKCLITLLIGVVLVGSCTVHAARKEGRKDVALVKVPTAPKVDPVIIAEHISEIVIDVMALARRGEDEERKVGPIIVRLFNSILQIILVATHKRGLPLLDEHQTALQEMLSDIDEETAQEIQRQLIMRTQRLISLCEAQ